MNSVAIKVYDKSKQLRFGETLTTGSRYAVQVEGGAATCGADAALILSTSHGLQVAVATLANGVGTLDLNCDAILKLEATVPFGTTLVLNAVLRCFDAGEEQNVGVGQCQVVAAWQGTENPDTGTVVYYKGAKGDPFTWDDLTEGQKDELAQLAAERVDGADTLLEGTNVRTNTVPGMRAAIEAIARALGATVALLALCALPAFGASVQTARLNDLDYDKNPSVVTNVTFTGLVTTDRVDEVEARISDYGTIRDRAMNARMYGDLSVDNRNWLLITPDGISRMMGRTGHDEWSVQLPEGECDLYVIDGGWELYMRWGGGRRLTTDGSEEDLTISFVDGDDTYRLLRGSRIALNTEIETLVDTIANIHIPDPDLSEYAKLYTVAALANFATNTDVKASTAISYLQGDDAKVVITNYDSSVHMPSMSFQQRIEEGGSNRWTIVWNELTRWNWLFDTYLPTNYYDKTQINGLLDEKADRAWGFYESHTGNWSPDGYTWISSPKIAIAAGLAYQRTITSSGAIWVLESNGLVTESGGNLTNGFFRVSDDEGNSILEIVKGNKRTVGANAEQPAVTNVMGVAHMYIRYSVVSESHPTLKICTALELGDWQDETSADCAANVSWTGTSGAYVAEVWGKTALSRMFVKAEYEIGGETYIKNSAPISADGGIYCTDGIHKVRFVYNNGSVTMEVTP